MSWLGLRSWVAVASLPVLGLSVGLIVSANATREYRATSTFAMTLRPTQPPGSIILIPTTVGVERLASTVAAIAQEPGPELDGMDLPISSQALAKELSAHGDDRTGLVSISVTDPDPRNSARYANAVAARLAQVVVSNTTGEDDIATITAVPSAAATVPTAPVGITWLPNEIAGGLCGLLGALVVMLANAKRRTRDPDNATVLIA